jgi:hypothetical protein
MGMIFYIIFTCDHSVFDPKFNPEIISTRKELITSLEVLNCSMYRRLSRMTQGNKSKQALDT